MSDTEKLTEAMEQFIEYFLGNSKEDSMVLPRDCGHGSSLFSGEDAVYR